MRLDDHQSQGRAGQALALAEGKKEHPDQCRSEEAVLPHASVHDQGRIDRQQRSAEIRPGRTPDHSQVQQKSTARPNQERYVQGNSRQ
jgi:hypothetical protein